MIFFIFIQKMIQGGIKAVLEWKYPRVWQCLWLKNCIVKNFKTISFDTLTRILVFLNIEITEISCCKFLMLLCILIFSYSLIQVILYGQLLTVKFCYMFKTIVWKSSSRTAYSASSIRMSQWDFFIEKKMDIIHAFISHNCTAYNC